MIEAVWHSRSWSARLLRACLVPLSMLFGLAVVLRNALYDYGFLDVRRAAVAVVSVGNLRVGGTGKTPFVIWLVERLRDRGLRVAVVSRGYGADPAPTLICGRSDAERVPSVASHGVKIVVAAPATAVDAADEAVLVALRTGAPVVTAADRYAACNVAERAFAPDVIVLDDGFQHRRLGRDVDVVLLARDDRAARMLPAGPLRESLRALRRAHVVLAHDPSPEQFRVQRSAVGIVRTVGREAALEPLEIVHGVPVTAVSALASNDDFFSMLRSLGARLVRALGFPDHHRYGAADWERISQAAEASRWIVTTEKDLVKLAPVASSDPRLCALRLALDVESGDEILALICARARLDERPRGQHDRARPRGVEA